MDNDLHNWGEAYKAIADRIRQQVPDIKHVDLYHRQEVAVDDDGNWIPFPAPAVFLEFNTAQVNDLGEGKQEMLMDITVYLYTETTADTNQGGIGQARALAFIALMRRLHQVLHGAEGQHFGPLSRTALRRVDAPPYAMLYAQTYSSHMLDYGAAPNFSEAQPPMPVDVGTPAPPPVPEAPDVRLYPFVG